MAEQMYGQEYGSFEEEGNDSLKIFVVGEIDEKESSQKRASLGISKKTICLDDIDLEYERSLQTPVKSKIGNSVGQKKSEILREKPVFTGIIPKSNQTAQCTMPCGMKAAANHCNNGCSYSKFCKFVSVKR